MVRFLRVMIIFVSFFSLIYAIFKYIQNPSGFYYIAGGFSALLAAVTSYLEINKKKLAESIIAGNGSNIINVNGCRNKTSIENNHKE